MPHRIPFLRVLLAQLLLITLALCSVALGQEVVLTGADANKAIAAINGHDWQLLAAALLPAIAWVIRRAQTSDASWLHTNWAKLVLVFLASAVGSLAPLLDSHTFTLQSLISALTVAIGAAVAVFNSGPGTVRATFAREVVAAEEGKGPMPIAPKAPLALLLVPMLWASGCAPPVVLGTAAVGAVAASSGCAHNPIICGTNGHLVAPDWTACFEAIVSAGASIPGAIAACSVNLGSAACIEDILNAGSDLLVACKPTCATVGARLGAGTTVEISRSNLRVNMIEALRASGKYPNAGR